MSVFNYYPQLDYNDEKARFILAHGKVVEKYLKDYRTFYNYIIKDEDRADIVAWNQYGDSRLDWIIYLINNIFDPYKDWPMSYTNFISYLEEKYDQPAYKLQGVSNNSTIAHYYYSSISSLSEEEKKADIANVNYNMTPETYDLLYSSNSYTWNSITESYLPATTGWLPKSIFDYEYEINESKREIILLRSEHITDFKRQFKDLFVKI